MSMENKSFLRTKMYGINVIFLFMALVIFFSKFQWVTAIAFAIIILLSFLSLIIRCEKCGALAYRGRSKDHGFPVNGWMTDHKCPSCGIERHGFFDGALVFLGNLFKGKK